MVLCVRREPAGELFPEVVSKQYATKFHENQITEVSLPMLDRQFLQKLGIIILMT